MIIITESKRQGIICSLQVSGHAGSDEYGKDLVCAGVSSIAVGMLNALDQLAKDTCQLSMHQDGDIQVVVKHATSENQMILKTAMVQFMTIEKTNTKFIRIKKQEV